MPRRRTSTAASKLKSGRGQGHGKSFKPFLYTREVPSRGLAIRIKGWKTDRVHHFLSILERQYFYILEWSPHVTDIREQFPLPPEVTMKIAERLGIKHPLDPKTKEPMVITTDFLVDVDDSGTTRLKARSIKPSNDLNDFRTLEKLEIERTYWHDQGVDWGIVTELEIPTEWAHNVEWVRSALDPAEAPGRLTLEEISFLENELFYEITADSVATLAQVGMKLDNRMGHRGGTALWVVRHLIASRQWEVDMTAKIDTNRPLNVKRAEAVAPAMIGVGAC